MTEEAILDNCKRLLDFYKDNSGLEINDYSEKGLLLLYSHILDYNGAHQSAMSRLYLTGNDYKDMEWYCKVNCDGFKKFESSFRFDALGYNWVVINK